MTTVKVEIRSIPLVNLRPASWNARKTRDGAGMRELAESVKKFGVQVPLLVRSFTSGPGLFEIVCGHRRFDALLDVQGADGEAPCIVRILDDDQARSLALVDNLQREDVPALEEADAYAELKQRLGTAEAIAARVGKDVSYVARRLQLVSLAEPPRRALAERLITIDHALLLARLGVDEQSVNLKWCLDTDDGKQEAVEKTIEYRIKDRDSKGRYSPWESQSVVELKHHIEQNVGRKLSRAPWSLDDAVLLPAAGACSACPSNTKANANLFSDLDIAAATCEDGGCFEFKREAFVQIRLSKATHDQANGPNLAASVDPAIRLSFRSTTVKPRVDKKTGTFSLSQTFKDGQWIEAKPKSCAYVRLGVTVDWSDDGNRGYMGSEKKLRKPGVILSVCVAEKCKVHRKAWEKAAGGAAKGEKQESYEAREAREKAEEEAFRAIENPVRRALWSAIAAKITDEQILRAVLQRRSNFHPLAVALEIKGDCQKKGAALISAAKATELPHLLLAVEFGGWLQPSRWERTQKDKGRGQLRELAKLAGVNFCAVEQKAEQLAKAEAKPKSIDKPTPKTATKKKVAGKAAKR